MVGRLKNCPKCNVKLNGQSCGPEHDAALLEWRRADRAAQAEYRARRRDAKYEAPPGTDMVVVGQPKLNQGHDGTPTTKHGFFRKKLQLDEQGDFEALYELFRATYKLDNAADDLLLQTALVNFVKSARTDPPNDGRDNHTARSLQAYYERQFADMLKHLGLTRAQREDGERQEDVAAALAVLFAKRRKPAEAPPEAGSTPAGGAEAAP